MQAERSSIDADEIARFAKDSGRWWDEKGPFRPLHRLNPTRIGYIRDRAIRHFGLETGSLKPFRDLSILDIGCGGGLVCEPLARLGGKVTGIDADGQAVGVAEAHAVQAGLSITYLCGSAEDLLACHPERSEGSAQSKPDQSKQISRFARDDTKREYGDSEKSNVSYDIVLALEIIEHVTEPEGFMRTCAQLCKPGGLVIFSTLNRTARSFALGIVAAEYVLGWVPRGTHDWKKFLQPAELARQARASGLEPADVTGMVYNPLKQSFALSKNDIAVNYFLTASRPL